MIFLKLVLNVSQDVKNCFLPISKGLIKDINLNKLNRKLFLLPDAALLAEKLPCKNIIRFNKPSIGYADQIIRVKE